MADYGNVGTDLGTIDAITSAPSYTTRLAGDSFTGASRGALGLDFSVTDCITAAPSYTTRLAGAGGSKGTDTGGGGGSARTTRTFGSVG